MSYSLNKVHSGDPLVIPAGTFNTFIDAARDFTRRQHDGGPGEARVAPVPDGIVLVKNATEASQARFAVLGVVGPVFEPVVSGETTDATAFAREVALTAVVPTVADYAERFVVLAEPLVAGAIGRAWISGVCPVQVEVPDGVAALSDRAELAETGETVKLTASARGSARILWKEAGTGTRWALVLLNAPEALCEDETYCPDASEGKSLPDALDATGLPSDEDHVYCTGWMYRDADGRLNPWITIDPTKLMVTLEGLVCIDSTYSPVTTPAGGSTATPRSSDATGSAASPGHVHATGHMYLDAEGKWNPWFVLDPSLLFCVSDTHAPEIPVPGVDDPPSTLIEPPGEDATGDPANNAHLHVAGHMYLDTAGKWNPWFVVDPSKFSGGGPHNLLQYAMHPDTLEDAEYATAGGPLQGDLIVGTFTVHQDDVLWMRLKRAAGESQVLYTTDATASGWDFSSGSGKNKVVLDDGAGHLIKDYPRAFVPV